jgi:MFS family permease
MPDNTSPPRSGLTVTQWLICIIASIGFAFDIYELLMMPLIVRDALTQLLGTKLGSPEYLFWVKMIFYVPFFVGGIIGLLGGYVTDLLGRRRVLTWSILLYAFSAFAAGFSTSMPMLLILRCLTLAGVCIEFVAAIAWLAELFPDPKQRERVLGYTQAFSSLGGVLVSAAFFLASRYGQYLPAIHGGHDAWRYTLISGVIPALPLIFIRPFLPESPAWEQKRKAGTLRRPSFAEIFSPALRRTTIITTIMFACSYGAAFGAIQQLPQIVPGLPGVSELTKPQQGEVISTVQFIQEMGGMLGRIALAYLVVVVVSRRTLIRIFQVPGLILVPIVFAYLAVTDLTLLKVGIFFVGFLTVAQFSFWGNYLPGVYPLHLRGTGESFAANFGGRILGTSAALMTVELSTYMQAATKEGKFAFAAAVVGTSVYVIGFLCSFFLPEPTEDLPE